MVKFSRHLNASLAANLAGIALAVYVGVLLAQTVKRNYDLGQQITTLQQEINNLQAQKQQLSFNLQYYQTASFAEREARANLGLQKPGENVIILPPKPEASANTTPAPAKPKQSNLLQWWNFLLGRS